MRRHTGRNPFYYRSSFIPNPRGEISLQSKCRNPFYYRSSFIHYYINKVCGGIRVAIPSITGLHSYEDEKSNLVVFSSQSLLLQVFIHTAPLFFLMYCQVLTKPIFWDIGHLKSYPENISEMFHKNISTPSGTRSP
jgi:hypothetical protein